MLVFFYGTISSPVKMVKGRILPKINVVYLRANNSLVTKYIMYDMHSVSMSMILSHTDISQTTYSVKKLPKVAT